MKDQEEYDDYLVDKAKELLNQEIDSEGERKIEKPEKPEMHTKRGSKDEKAERESTSKIPFTWDPREIQHLVENRPKMDNQEMREFLEKETELQEELEEVNDWKGFSRWEERFMIQNWQNMEPEEIADQMDREEKKVRLKMRMLGLDVEF